jgi:SAM-dependent methyltransferase
MVKPSPCDGFIHRQKWFVEKILSPCSGLTIDLGCGQGLWSKKLKERGIQVIGVDSSMDRLIKCRAEGNNDDLVCASAANLPFASDSLDSVLFLETIEHMDEEQQDRSLKEIHRVLKPRGLVVVTTPNRPIYRLLAKSLRLCEYNPEHVRELSLAEAKRMAERYFALVSVDGKLGFLDKLIPTAMCWDILVIAEKP